MSLHTISEARTILGLSQREAAEMAGISVGTWRKAETHPRGACINLTVAHWIPSALGLRFEEVDWRGLHIATDVGGTPGVRRDGTIRRL